MVKVLADRVTVFPTGHHLCMPQGKYTFLAKQETCRLFQHHENLNCLPKTSLTRASSHLPQSQAMR